MKAQPTDILNFWFGPPGSAVHGTTRGEWFRKDAAFDAEIRSHFGPAIEAALAGGMTDWVTPHAALARILLLDQFTRNVFRGSPRAIAGDAIALTLATTMVEQGLDRQLDTFERWFAYLPF